MKRQPISAAQWWHTASGAFAVVAECLDMAKRAELREEGHECGHTFRIQVSGRGHSWGVITDNPPTHSDANWWHDDGTVEIRAHNLRDALLLAAAKPLAEWGHARRRRGAPAVVKPRHAREDAPRIDAAHKATQSPNPATHASQEPNN